MIKDMAREIFLVQAEYVDKIHGTALVSPCGWSFNYEDAKRLCERVVNEDKAEGQIPEDYDGWNEPQYHDLFSYDDEMTKIDIYVCSVDEIEN